MPNHDFKIFEKDSEIIINRYYSDILHLIPTMTKEMATDVILEKVLISDILTKLQVSLDKMSKSVVLGITTKYLKLNKGEILNHTAFKMSDFDIEIAQSLPQGGSWKNLPREIINKSKRLQDIEKDGGRTTLYGRMHYAQPSYTLTTLFNRPSAGTHVHPIHNRVLSLREAARIQGFLDTYFFVGNKNQLLKQVGNAVPSIFAFQIAKQIMEKTDCRKSIDLFCGAGGFALGFKKAGIETVISTDIEESACMTLKINNPEIDTYVGDITLASVKEHLVKVCEQKGVDIICGGPPCQGFSLSGHRLADDPRNKLFTDFLGLVSEIKPKIVVFENVQGLLSFQKGAVYKEILRLFQDLGYSTEARLLKTNEYGVPQKRKRVIVIAVRKDMGINPNTLFPVKITEDSINQTNMKQTIEDLEMAECGEMAYYYDTEQSDIVKLFKEKMSYDDFVKGLSKKGNELLSENSIFQLI